MQSEISSSKGKAKHQIPEEVKPLVVIIGANAVYGESVMECLLKDKNWNIRALVDDVHSEKSKRLVAKGVEVWKCDLGRKDDVVKALRGVNIVYAVTDFWSHHHHIHEQLQTLEEIYGKNLVDACIENNVNHFLWSSLADVDKSCNHEYDVPHFTNKHRVEQYARSKNKHLRSTFLYMGFFMQNFLHMFPFILSQDRKKAFLELPLNTSTKLPLFDAEDIGPIVLYILKHSHEYGNKNIYCASNFLSIQEIMQHFEKVIQISPLYNQVNYQTFLKHVRSKDLVNMFKFIEDYGFFGDANKTQFNEVHKMYALMTTFEQFLHGSKNKILQCKGSLV